MKKSKAIGSEEIKNHYKEKSSSRTQSFFIYYIDLFFEFCYNSFFKGFFGKLFASYSEEEDSLKNGFLYHCWGQPTKFRKRMRKIREFFSRGFSNSFFIRKAGRALRKLVLVPMRSYGNILFSFGAYTALIWVIKLFINSDSTVIDFTDLYVGMAVCLISIPMLLSSGSLVANIYKGKITNFIFLKMFGFKDEIFQSEEAPKKHHSNVMFLGMLLGLLTAVVSPLSVITVLVAAILLALVMTNPEIGVLLSLFCIPFFSFSSHPTLALLALILITAFSFIIKVVRGKRTWSFKLIDIFVILFIVLLYFSGLITVGGSASFDSAVVSIALMFIYFLIVNLMRSDVWLKRCLLSFAGSAVVVAIIGIAQYLSGHLEIGTIDADYFKNIQGRVVSLFENSNVLGNYLAIIFPLCLAIYIFADKKYFKLFAFVSVISIVICTVLTWSRSAWLAMLISSLIFLFVHNRKTGRLFFFGALALPFVSFIIPDNIIERFLSIGNIADSSTMYRVYTWKGTLKAISENFWNGIGYGNEAFQKIYPQFAYSGIELAEHSHNLFLQILLSMGIGGLLAFIAVIFLTFQQNLEFIRDSKDREGKLFTTALFASLISALIMGMFDYLWFNYRIFFMFWCVIAMSSAYFRTARNEKKRKETLSRANARSIDAEYSV